MTSEFIALDMAGEEVEWLRHFLEDVPSWSKYVPAICIHCDRQLVIGRVTCIMISLDIYVVDTIPLDNYSQME